MSSHLTLEQIRAILDPRDYNVTFPTVADLKASTGQWLSPAHAAPFAATTAAQAATIEAWIALRNELAHRSKSSKARMNVALGAGQLPAHLRRGANTVRDASKFLRAIPAGQQDRRVLLLLDEMEDLARAYCP